MYRTATNNGTADKSIGFSFRFWQASSKGSQFDAFDNAAADAHHPSARRDKIHQRGTRDDLWRPNCAASVSGKSRMRHLHHQPMGFLRLGRKCERRLFSFSTTNLSAYQSIARAERADRP